VLLVPAAGSSPRLTGPTAPPDKSARGCQPSVSPPAAPGTCRTHHKPSRQVGRSADHQTPYYESDRTPEGDAEQGAFAEVITAALERLRKPGRAQAAPAAQPPKGIEVGTNTALAVPPETKPATEWVKGAQTAHDLIIRQAEAGYSADHIAGKWEEALSTYDDATATAAERAWHAGAKETSADMIQTLREMERAEAEQAQAARDAAGTEPEHEAEAG
jgi:hypothetical protein